MNDGVEDQVVAGGSDCVDVIRLSEFGLSPPGKVRDPGVGVELVLRPCRPAWMPSWPECDR